MDGYKNSELGAIPDEWNVNPLGVIGEVKMCRRVFNSETMKNGTIPFYKIGTFGKEPDAYISEELYCSYRKKFSYPNKGDILISASGTLGRTIVYDGKPSYFQDSNIVWIGNNEKVVTNKFLYYVLQVVKYESEGSTIQRLYNNIIKNTKFILPPLPEQQAIAEILSDTDNLIKSLEKQIAKKRLIKQGTMQKLLLGINRLNQFINNKGNKQTEIGSIPIDWEVLSFTDIANLKHGFQFMEEHFSKTGVGVIKIGNLNNSAGLDLHQLTFIPEGRLKHFRKFLLEEGDVLMALTGATLGKVARVNSKRELVQNYRVGNFIPNSKTTREYLFHISQSFLIQRTVKYLVNEAAQPNLGKADFDKILIPVPSIPEQNAIAKILSEMDLELEVLEKKLSKFESLKQGLMKNLLTGKTRLLKT